MSRPILSVFTIFSHQSLLLRQEESESVRQVSLSPPVPDEIIVREVMEEMLGNMIPDLTRVIVNETISDFIIRCVDGEYRVF